MWQKIAKLGWLGIVFPEGYGGTEGTFVDLVLLMEEAGKALFPGPLIAAIVSGLCIHHYGNRRQREEFLPKLIQGELIVSPALIKPDPAAYEDQKEEKAVKNEGHVVLDGTRLFVPFGHVANRFIYSADIEKEETLFLIDAEGTGVKCTSIESIGGDKPCELTLEGVKVPEKNALGGIGKGEEISGKINEWGALLESAFISGMLEQVLKMTVEHAKEREQFDRKIGSFQAIQHQCADMATDIDETRFLTYGAAWKLSRNLSAEKEVSMAKALASEASRRVCLLGIKIHGGTGVSREHDMQLYFRRAKASELAFGDGDFHREVIAGQLGL